MIALLFIGEEHEEPRPCNGLRRRLTPPDCLRFDARLDTLRTSPTSDVGRVPFRNRRGALTFREGVLQGSQRQWIVRPFASIRGQEGVS